MNSGVLDPSGPFIGCKVIQKRFRGCLLIPHLDLIPYTLSRPERASYKRYGDVVKTGMNLPMGHRILGCPRMIEAIQDRFINKAYRTNMFKTLVKNNTMKLKDQKIDLKSHPKTGAEAKVGLNLY